MGHLREYGVLTCRVRCSPDSRPEVPAPNPPWWPPGIAVFVAPTAPSGDSVVGKPREWTSTGSPYRPAAAVRQGRGQRIFFLDCGLLQVYMPVVFFRGAGRGASAFAKASADRPTGILTWAGLLGEASGKGGLPAVALAKAGRNVYFCFGKKYK